MQKFQYFVRRHPFLTGAGTTAGFAAMLFLLFFAQTRTKGWEEPARIFPNIKTGRLEVYSARDSLLRAIPSSTLGRTSDGDQFENVRRRSVLADIDGDGREEIVTTLALWGETEEESLRVIQGDGSIAWAVGFNREVPHRSKSYPASRFRPGSLSVIQRKNQSGVDIFVGCGNMFSPTFIARLDNEGHEIGTWWHFGSFQFVSHDLLRTGSPQLLVHGEDDTPDNSLDEYPFVALLEPDSIVGNRQSGATPFFKYPLSRSEIYYVTLPLSDLHHVMRSNAGSTGLHLDSDSTFYVDIGGFASRSTFSFHFNRRIEVYQVKSKNATDVLHDRLRSDGRIFSVMGPGYLEQLRHKVQYWDGRLLREKATKVARWTDDLYKPGL